METNQAALVAVFDDRLEAERAVRDLEAAGFDNDRIGFVIRGSDAMQGGMITDASGTKDGKGAIVGAATGAVTGGIFAAAATILLPGIGPVVAAGLWTSIFGGAIAGTAIGGILGALIGLGVSEEEAQYYEQMFHSGKAIVAVKPGLDAVTAGEILRRHGGYDMRTRSTSPLPTEGTFSQP